MVFMSMPKRADSSRSTTTRISGLGRGVSLAMSTNRPCACISCSILAEACCSAGRLEADISIWTGRDAPGPDAAASIWMPKPGTSAVAARSWSITSVEGARVRQSVNSTWIWPITSLDRLERTRSSTLPMVRE